MYTLFNRKNNTKQIWAARLLIAVVLFWNLQAAFLFMLTPNRFVHAFQLEGFRAGLLLLVTASCS